MLNKNNNKLVIFVLSLFVLQSFITAKPVLELGTKVTHYGALEEAFYIDTVTGQRIQRVYAEPYYGTSVEFLMSFVKRLYFRTDLLELRIFKRGGQAIYSFPFLDSDVLYELPLRSKFLPYLFGGIGFQLYFGHQDALDARFAFGKTYNIRTGLGIRYKLNPKIKFFVESPFYTDIYTYGEILDKLILESRRLWVIGINNKINLGARFSL